MVVDTISDLTGDCCCPLCKSEDIRLYHKDRIREYYTCMLCCLVFVPEKFHVSLEAEKKLYDMHENSADDAGYLKFLSRFSTPFLESLGKGKQLCGLDYGCGEAPALAGLLQRGGHKVHLYDPIYACDDKVLKGTYDFISTTEVVEHFRDPEKDFNMLFRMLKKGGWLGIMTKMVRDQKSFTTWHYIRDMTHVAFYSRETFHYIARHYGADVSFNGNDVIFFRKT